MQLLFTAPDRNPENIKIQGHLPHQMDISWEVRERSSIYKMVDWRNDGTHKWTDTQTALQLHQCDKSRPKHMQKKWHELSLAMNV